MSDTPDWTRWLERRRQLSGELDEQAQRLRVEAWAAVFRGETPLPEEVLDQALVELLRRIQRDA